MRTSILLLAVAIVLGTASHASAHAISIGFENAGPGSVNIWLGTYGHGGHHLEGSMQLEGALGTVFGPEVNPFTMLTATGVEFKPAGLVDGTTNFYVSTQLDVNGPLVGTEAPWNAICPACGPVNHWQGVNFSGLAEGTYQFTYVPIANPSQEWDPWNNSLNGTFDLSDVVVPPPPVPEPGSLALLTLALAGWGVSRFRGRQV